MRYARRPAMWITGFALLCGAAGAAPPHDAEPHADLAGTWIGTLVHGADTTAIALAFVPDTAGRLEVRLSLPVIHLDAVPVARAAAEVRGDSVRVGPFAFRRDRAGGKLAGVMPRSLVPVYDVAITLERAAGFTAPARRPPAAPPRRPLWTYDAGSAIWAGPAFARGVVYAGTQAGEVHAIDARRGSARWVFRAGGAVRVRPCAAGDAVYAQADDGHLYRVSAREGRLVWKTRIVRGPIVRLPFSDPRSRYDRFGSDVTVAGGRLYVGTHDGRMLALDAEDGRVLWSFETADAVLAAPRVADGRVLFGSYDGSVYALAESTGTLLWRRDTRGAVVSTPAIAGHLAIVGNRCYDLLALDAASGDLVWKRYMWMSWVESSAAVRDGVVYVGSSDAAALFAFEAATGAPLWKTDVHGWAWGEPVVASRRVYAGTASRAGYPAGHAAGFMALDRESGAPLWRYASAAADTGAFGFAGSAALGDGRVYAAALDGRVHAFAE